jgi:hypothetical protein
MKRQSLVITATATIGTAIALNAISPANAAFINTNDLTVYNNFAAGGTVQNFETIGGMSPLSISAYNVTPSVPAAAQLGLQLNGVFFHSGGGSFNNPVGNPGTPAALLQLSGGIAGNARSGTNVVGSMEINTTNLDLSQFIEIVFTNTLQNRVGVWLNPALGNVTMTAFDSTGNSLESGVGTAGNFAGFQRASNDIKFISIVSGPNRFTVDDLTYGVAGTPSTAAPEPGTLALAAFAVPGMAALVLRRKRRTPQS